MSRVRQVYQEGLSYEDLSVYKVMVLVTFLYCEKHQGHNNQLKERFGEDFGVRETRIYLTPDKHGSRKLW